MVTAHRIELVLAEDGRLLLDKLPFRSGQSVEVIVLAKSPPPSMPPNSVRGAVITYDRPTDPVADSDWSTLQ